MKIIYHFEQTHTAIAMFATHILINRCMSVYVYMCVCVRVGMCYSIACNECRLLYMNVLVITHAQSCTGRQRERAEKYFSIRMNEYYMRKHLTYSCKGNSHTHTYTLNT